MRIELVPEGGAEGVGAGARAGRGRLIVSFAIAGLVVWGMGRSPVAAFQIYILDPLTDPWSLREIAMKATPLVIIAIGLSYCFSRQSVEYRSGGQFIVGAIFGSWLALATHGTDCGDVGLLPLMMILAMIGGALLRRDSRLFCACVSGVNEILTSLFPRLVAQLLLDYLVRGPWRDPMGLQLPAIRGLRHGRLRFPQSPGWGRVHIGVIFALIAVIVTLIVLGRHAFGYRLRVSGDAPRAAAFRRFSRRRAPSSPCSASPAGWPGWPGLSSVSGRAAPGAAVDLAGLRVHGDHRGLSRAAQSGRHPRRRLHSWR